MRKALFASCIVLASGCATQDYSRSCDGVADIVAQVAEYDKRIAKVAQGYLDACNGESQCVDSVISAFLPINVLTQSTYRFAESLQRGGICSAESIAIVKEHADKIKEIFDAYTK